MEKGYNIDDILSEVKKRREENEAQIKSDNEAAQKVVEEVINSKKPEPVVEDITPNEEQREKPEDIYSQTTNQTENTEIEQKTEAEPQNTVDVKLPKTDEKPLEPLEPLNVHHKKKDRTVPKSKEEFVDVKDIVEQNNDYDNYYINSSDKSDRDRERARKKKKKNDKKKKKNTAIRVILILLIIVLCAGIGVYWYVNNILDTVTDENADKQTNVSQVKMDERVESFDPIEEADASEIGSLQDMIKKWYKNGTPASSSRVLNIMLIGEDTRGKKVLESGTRADSAIVASVNLDTKQIKLTSILRDAYAYWETTPGDESTGHFGKINGAMSTYDGNIHTYISAVENLYKIKIDNYVIVNFTSFEKIIDNLGGVELELTSAEINEINNHQKRYGGVYIDKTFDGTKGMVKLSGKQALAYCRIRKIDSDNMRANRQKICLSKVFSDMKNASSVQLLKILNDMVPYIRTDMPKSNIVSTAKYALSEGWMSYDVFTSNVPEYRNDENGAGGTFYGAWCWKADYPMDAYMLQMDIYGKSSITLARTRVDYINCRESGFYSETGYAVQATYTNENYGEVTTRAPEKESTTKSN
ncbi:LCP family protein [uncultured Eubacterium sp.]|uniref:LCP family protein n=1 Tax=uncultured Eubacterium sp. TaxID=165185 RepID=UPI0025D4A939|nr:LCP family protein [uncultured Eubacterium sp.]